MKYEKFDVDKFKPNFILLGMFMITTLTFVWTGDKLHTVFLGLLSILLLGWIFMFGKYKKS